MRVRLTPRALREAKRLKTWWLQNRDAVELFDEEMRTALESIERTPTIGGVYSAGRSIIVRRLLMPKTHNHIYYATTEDEIVVLSVWGAPRERGPKL
jgi:plasmid stabilization system protein ParE